ncbi:MAG: hypothetical protein ACI9VN_000200 [Patescibacteria group bacterium]|jgi:hypothetical protein
MNETDDNFFSRADEHIDLANKHLSSTSKGKVSASMMYSLARFNSWISACGFDKAEEMKEAKAETVKYFLTEYEKMLNENFDDYIGNFDKYMKQKEG